MTDELVLTTAQMAVVSFLGTIIVQVLKAWVATTGKAIHRKTVTWLLVALAFIMAAAFAFPKIPAFPDLAGVDSMAAVLAVITWLVVVIGILGGTAGFAALIYNTFMENVFTAIGLNTDVIQDKALVAKGLEPVNGTIEGISKG